MKLLTRIICKLWLCPLFFEQEALKAYVCRCPKCGREEYFGP